MALFGWSYTSSVVLISIILFFLLAVINKFGNMFMPYNRWTSWAGGLIPFVLTAYIWKLKPALIIGLVLGIVGGIVGGISLGATSPDE